MGSPPPLRFHLDLVSPWAFLAWTQIHSLAGRHGRQVEAVPVLFAGLLGAHGTLGPAEVPAKRTHLVRACLRTAALLEVPLAAPPSHPFDPLLGLRALTHVLASEPGADRRRAAVEALFTATWRPAPDGSGPPGVTEPAVVAAALDAAGLDGEAAVAAAGTPAVKDRLRAQTERAIDEGVFGVPTVTVGDGPGPAALFWGLDALPLLDRHLACAARGEPDLDPEAVARWDRVTPSARRSR